MLHLVSILMKEDSTRLEEAQLQDQTCSRQEIKSFQRGINLAHLTQFVIFILRKDNSTLLYYFFFCISLDL